MVNSIKKSSGIVHLHTCSFVNIYYRDAWKRLEGVSEMEAKHRYVEILLQVTMEVYIYI
jgi:acyl-CoA-binding protein